MDSNQLDKDVRFPVRSAATIAAALAAVIIVLGALAVSRGKDAATAARPPSSNTKETTTTLATRPAVAVQVPSGGSGGRSTRSTGSSLPSTANDTEAELPFDPGLNVQLGSLPSGLVAWDRLGYNQTTGYVGSVPGTGLVELRSAGGTYAGFSLGFGDIAKDGSTKTASANFATVGSKYASARVQMELPNGGVLMAKSQGPTLYWGLAANKDGTPDHRVQGRSASVSIAVNVTTFVLTVNGQSVTVPNSAGANAHATLEVLLRNDGSRFARMDVTSPSVL